MHIYLFHFLFHSISCIIHFLTEENKKKKTNKTATNKIYVDEFHSHTHDRRTYIRKSVTTCTQIRRHGDGDAVCARVEFCLTQNTTHNICIDVDGST